jgi:hypothetical protein
MSEKSIAQKLLIKENRKVLLLNEPSNYRSKLGKLPQNVAVTTEPSAKPFDIVQLFVTSKKELEVHLPKVKALAAKNGLLWVTYPKGTSQFKTDINRDVIREFGATVGLQAVALVSIDETWSALRLKIL